MIACFMNFHEKENAQDLKKHLDRVIERAIEFGCSVFVSGKKYPEDKIFEERVKEIKKHYEPGEVNYVGITVEDDEELKNLFIHIADWEMYSYEEI